jgi:PhoH-like ATPase
MRVRAKAFGMSAQNYDENKNVNEMYNGAKTICNTELGNKLKKSKLLHCSNADELEEMSPNECVFFKDANDEGIALGRRIKNDIRLIPTQKPWGLSSNNVEQAYVIDLLMDPKVPLVTLSGKAGTGKTLVAVACGLESVINNKQYNNLLIYRPIQPVGTDMGYLPGELADKLEPWMAAIHDSMDFLTARSRRSKRNGNGNGNGNGSWKNTLANYGDKVSMEALTYIRGRSIANSFILMDETQNVSKEEIKTILTRVGHGTKIVLTGDIEQIDNYHLDAMNNGLTYVINKFQDSPLAGHVTLTQGERSALASYAADIL